MSTSNDNYAGPGEEDGPWAEGYAGRMGFIPEQLEDVAALEHEQWIHWSTAVAKSDLEAIRSLLYELPEYEAEEAYKIIDALIKKWEASWVPYAELPDQQKVSDRGWAVKVLDYLRPNNMKAAVLAILQHVRLAGWNYATIEPENKDAEVQGFIIGTAEFCSDAITIISNVLEEVGCQTTRSSETLDLDADLSLD